MGSTINVTVNCVHSNGRFCYNEGLIAYECSGANERLVRVYATGKLHPT